MAGLCADAGAALVVMHTRSRPKERLVDPAFYDDVVGDVVGFLEAKIAEAVALGLDEDAIVVDPGPDFAKTPAQTVAVLRALDEVRRLGRPLLLALSRKDFLGAIVRKPPAAAAGGDDGGRRPHRRRAREHRPGPRRRRRRRDVLAVVDVLAGRAEVDPAYELPMSLRREPTGPSD